MHLMKIATEMAEVWEECLSGGGGQEGCDRSPVESGSEVSYDSDATCVTPKDIDIPLGLRK
jgi:hypothetical protein